MKKMILVSAVIIEILFIAGLFLFSQNQNLKKEINVLNQKINELQKTKPEPVAEKIPEGWKEYIDEEYKFRIWYPEEFTAYGETAEVRVEKLINDYGIKDNWINEVQVYMPLTSDAPVFLLRIYI